MQGLDWPVATIKVICILINESIFFRVRNNFLYYDINFCEIFLNSNSFPLVKYGFLSLKFADQAL